MTAAEAMFLADQLRPNALDMGLRRKWLTDIENECVEHLNRHEGNSMEPWVCTEEEDGTELILSEPYEMAYVYKLMAEIDRAVAEVKLSSLGITLDTLTPAQRQYLNEVK